MLTLLLKQPIAQGYVYFEIILFFGGHKFIRVLGLILLFFVGFFLPVKFPHVTKTAFDVPYPLSSCPVGLLSQRDLIFLFFWLYFICSNQSQDLCFVKIFQVCHLLINPVALECFFFFRPTLTTSEKQAVSPTAPVSLRLVSHRLYFWRGTLLLEANAAF